MITISVPQQQPVDEKILNYLQLLLTIILFALFGGNPIWIIGKIVYKTTDSLRNGSTLMNIERLLINYII